MTDRDLEQDNLIRSNSERITRNEEAILRQTEALEKIRDHYYPPPPGFLKSAFRLLVKAFCVVMAYLGIAQTLDWIWNVRESRALAERYADVAKRLFYEQGNAAAAARYFEKAIALDTGESEYKVELTFMRGMALSTDIIGVGHSLTASEREQVNAAYEEAQMLAEVNPDDPNPYVLMAQSLMLCGETEESIKKVMRAIECDPENASVRISACVFLFSAGRFQEARRQLVEAERLAPNLPSVACWKGMFALKMDRDVVAARGFFEEMTKRAPRLPIGYALLGRALLAGDRPDMARARTAFEHALLLDANQRIALIGMAETYENEQNFLVAKIWLDRVLNCDANSVKALVARARINGKLGDVASEIADLTAAIALDPFNAELVQLRADVHARAGDESKAKSDRAMVEALNRRTK